MCKQTYILIITYQILLDILKLHDDKEGASVFMRQLSFSVNRVRVTISLKSYVKIHTPVIVCLFISDKYSIKYNIFFVSTILTKQLKQLWGASKIINKWVIKTNK